MATVVFITGASKGYGRALALAFAAQEPGCTVMLMGRDETGLAETVAHVAAAHPSTTLKTQILDLGKLESIEAAWQAAVHQLGSREAFQRAILINNAGSLGPLGAVASLSDLHAIQDAVNVNITSTVWMTSLFLRWLKEGGGVTQSSSLPHAVVNISSLCGIKPFASQSLYCLGKAARDMLHAVIAEECASSAAASAAASSSSTAPATEGDKPLPSIVTLNYAPGPMETAMQAELRESSTLDAAMRELFVGLHREGKLVDTGASAAKCAALLAKPGLWSSGAHIDFFDAVKDL